MKTKIYSLVATCIIISCSILAQPFPGKIGVNLDGPGGIGLDFPTLHLPLLPGKV